MDLTEEQIKSLHQTQGLMQNQQLMGEVIAQMKEIPQLPSEVPTDVHALTHVEMPDTGGVYTYMEGYEHPYKGFPFHEFVDKIDTLKKLSRGMLSSLFHSLKKRNKLQVLTLGFCIWFFNDLLKAALYAFHRVIIRFKIKELRYSTAVREVYRVLSGTETENVVRDILCMVLENDNAYRFRFQDIVPDVNQDAIVVDTVKELKRLLVLLRERERGQDVKDTWTLIITFLPFYLFFNPAIKDCIKNAFLKLDMEKVRLSPEDLQFCKPRTDYKFSFMEL